MNTLLSPADLELFDEDSDEALVQRSRDGDSQAFAELWRRHSDAAIGAARRFTSIDAEDLVSEAYARIYRALLDGGGPTGAFRPYLYVTVRNLAARWGRKAKEVNIEGLDEVEDPDSTVDGSLAALDLSLTAVAFSRLPDRWRSVLWYTEVQQMNPQDVAPILGISANTVAALSYRARDGLRKEWLQAHIKVSGVEGDCRWTLARAADYTRGGLSSRTRGRMRKHLRTCMSCSLIVQEVDQVRSGLAMALVPALIGGGLGGGALLASIAPAGAASAAGILGWFAAPAAAAGALALTVGLAGGMNPALPHSTHALAPVASAPAHAQAAPIDLDSNSPVPVRITTPVITVPGTQDSDPAGTEPTGGGDGSGGSDGSGSSGSGSSGTGGTDTTTPTAPTGLLGATISLNLTGTGTPGASVALQALGIVYVTTTIGVNGTFSLSLAALPQGVTALQLVQTAKPGVLSGLLGGVTNFVGSLLEPLALTSGGASGVTISLVN